MQHGTCCHSVSKLAIVWLIVSSLSRAAEFPLEKKLHSLDDRVLAQTREQVANERRELVAALLSIVTDKHMQSQGIVAVVNAIEILGDLRATEAVPSLLDLIDYDRLQGLNDVFFRIPADPSADPLSMSKAYPCVGALIKIGVPPVDLLRLIEHPPGRSTLYYVAVLIGSMGRPTALVILRAELAGLTAALTPADKEIERRLAAHEPVTRIGPTLSAKRTLERALKRIEAGTRDAGPK